MSTPAWASVGEGRGLRIAALLYFTGAAPLFVHPGSLQMVRLEHDCATELLRPPAGELQHARRQVDGGQFHVARVEGEVQAGAYRQFERPAARSRTELPAAIAEHRPVVMPHPLVIACCRPAVEAPQPGVGPRVRRVWLHSTYSG